MKQLTTSIKHRLLMMFLLLFIYSLNVVSQNRYKVSCQKLNVRSAPTQKAQVIGSLVEGDIISVENINDGWATINYKGKTSYISAAYIEKTESAHKNTNTQSNKTLHIQKAEEQPKEQSSPTTISKTQTVSNINRTMWHFSIGGMPQTNIYDENSINWFAQLGGDIPVKITNIPFIIETGIRYLNKTSAIVIGDYYDYYTNKASLLEIPVRLGYDLPLGKDFSFRFGAGPYFSYMLNNGGGLQIGLEPTAALKYKNFSMGVQYSVPIVKGYTNEINNTLMLALTIRFNSKAWKGIGTGLIIAGTTATIVGSVVTSQNSNSENIDINDMDDYSDTMEDENSRKNYSKKRYQDLYDEYAKKAKRSLDEGTKADIANVKELARKTTSASEINIASKTHQIHKRQYRQWSKRMIQIYNEAAKKGYKLKKASFHGDDYPDIHPPTIVNKVSKYKN